LQEAAIISGRTFLYRRFLRLSFISDAGTVYYFVGIETRGKSIEEIDRELAA
jgi:hypothetical protein